MKNRIIYQLVDLKKGTYIAYVIGNPTTLIEDYMKNNDITLDCIGIFLRMEPLTYIEGTECPKIQEVA